MPTESHNPRHSARRRAAEVYFRLRSRPPVVSRRRPAAPPDFIGIGTQRSGTSWWHSLIEAHPDVHGLGWPFKELHFFDRFATEEFSYADIDAYHQWFRRPSGRIAGEWTPRYMFDPTTPTLLHRAAPDAKLLVLLRDPIARFRSGFTHACARGVPQDIAWDDAMRRGLYFEQLERVLAVYPREQVAVLQFERCVADPAAMLAHTYGFLGLAPFRPAARLDQPVNQSRVPPTGISSADHDRLYSAYADDAEALAAAFPEIDLGLWTALR